MKKVIGLVVAVLIAGCGGAGVKSDGSSSGSSASAPAQSAVDTSFYQHWVHSHEEQNGQPSPNIFRPKGSREFAPSRFRMEYAFDLNGQCNYMLKSPTDAHEMRDCIYTKIGNSVYFYDSNGVRLSHLAFTIQSVNQDEMRFAYGVASPSPDKKVAQ